MEKYRKAAEEASRNCAGIVLGIPPNRISGDDTIMFGFMQGAQWMHNELQSELTHLRKENAKLKEQLDAIVGKPQDDPF